MAAELSGLAGWAAGSFCAVSAGTERSYLESLHCSAICGVARVVDIVTSSRSKWFWRPDDGSVNFGWVLADVTALKQPVRCKGALGLWTLTPTQFRELQRQLPRLRLDS